jgi:regulator of cell morphogenesis and NO signaling
MTDTIDCTLGELVLSNPGAARVLERHHLDYCCGGHRSLREACARAGIDGAAILDELDEITSAEPSDWAELDPVALARHIVETHHRYLHEELPLLDALAEKVLAAHGQRHPELGDMRTLVAHIRADLEPHLMKEERVLFPAIEALAAGQRDFPFGTVGNPIRMMEQEHDRAGRLLKELRAVTYGFEIPRDACASYRSLYERLEHLEADTHEHIHKENNVLFPAAAKLQAQEAQAHTAL